MIGLTFCQLWALGVAAWAFFHPLPPLTLFPSPSLPPLLLPSPFSLLPWLTRDGDGGNVWTWREDGNTAQRSRAVCVCVCVEGCQDRSWRPTPPSPLSLASSSRTERLLLSHERCWDTWPLEEKNSTRGQWRGLITRNFCVIKFYWSIKEIEKASHIDIRRGQKECPPARL